MPHPSPISNREDTTQSHPTVAGPSVMSPLPQRPRQSSENPTYRQQSTQDLGQHQKAGGTASHGIFPQPDPMTTDELITIYVQLMRVESKCKEIREAESDSRAPFDNKKWQGLVNLHQILVQEHHEFFRASQHLTTSHVLRRLPEIHATPMRLWRYSIHSFLELLRHRLPDSCEHMLSYINFAYFMMTLLRETVPRYQSTWAEALGNLSEYCMKLEIFDVEEREVWTKAARSWYTNAADMNPDVGRIQYHLAILA
ncbi:uncharacterized protein NFIA_060730 [Aspergillus fischeri NRRL 181]|uniref:DNA/RNA-binding domain-containing protein n=1 Tax=Neosartorya fischeri (strain ATCC 1020 / DSM 3700 / CBS 544.65 / FGSC A1164 / JCM 1740 / NRRL 181 / WB 181) TaxID=331117 RepID=A1DPJ6_NEOFI|nr:uncharacterized protein NFIA_060730 [Aspergillus fischeri NRRL 181]EAW16717.1 hypothetical protein NFIA_060730 [Aspergillus fischeri NRRL 181]